MDRQLSDQNKKNKRTKNDLQKYKTLHKTAKDWATTG